MTWYKLYVEYHKPFIIFLNKTHLIKNPMSKGW